MAHDAYLRGWAHYKLLTPESLAKAVPFLEEAIRLDPNYAPAHAALASVYWDAYQNDWAFDLDMPSFRAESWANEHLEEALKAPTPMAHALQARMFAALGFPGEAVVEAEKAVALDENDATALAGLASALVLAERSEEGSEFIRKAMRLDPHHPPSYLITLGAAHFGMEQYGDAAATFEHAVKRNPDNELPWIYLASSYGHLGRTKDGDAAIEAANDLRAKAGMGDLSLERKSPDFYSPFQGEIDFTRFGGRPAQERVRSGLSEIPALTWQYLVTPHPIFDVGNTWWEVEGATEVDAATAKSLYDRGVVFIDASTVQWWNEGHIAGAVNLPLRDKEFPAKERLSEATLMEIVDKTAEVVFYERGYRYAPFACVKTLTWGFERVYYFQDGIDGWKQAGHPVETAQ